MVLETRLLVLSVHQCLLPSVGALQNLRQAGKNKPTWSVVASHIENRKKLYKGGGVSTCSKFAKLAGRGRLELIGGSLGKCP